MKNKKSHWPLTILSVLVSFLNLGLPLLMVRLLPVEQIGLHRVFFFYIQAVPAFSLSVGLVNGVYFWAGRGLEGRLKLQTAGALLLWLSLCFSILLLLFEKAFSAWLGFDFTVTLIFIMACIPQIMNFFYEASEVATGHIWRGAGFSAFFEFLRASILLIFLYWKRDVIWILTIHTGLMWMKVLLGMIFGHRRNLFRFWPEKTLIKPVLEYAGPVSWASVFDQLVASPDRYILSSLISKADFAVYSMGCLALPPLSMFEQAVNKILIPEMSQAFAQGQSERVVQLYCEAVRELMLFLLPASIGLILFAEPIIELLFTPKYLAAQEYLKFYALTYILYAIPFDVVFRALGDSKWILKTQVIFGVFSLITVGLTNLIFGAKGALIATIICQVFLRVYALKEMRRRLNFKWKDIFPWSEMRLFVLVISILAVVSGLVRSFFSSDIIWFSFTGIIFAVLYLLNMAYVGQIKIFKGYH